MRLAGYPPAEFVARGVAWMMCLGFTYEDAKRVHSAAAAAIEESRSAGRSSVRDLFLVVYASVGHAVRNSRRWDWREFLHRLLDIPVHAAMGALPVAAAVGVTLALLLRSTTVAVLAGTAAGFVTLLARAVRRIRRSIRYESDEPYRRYMSQPSARWLTAANVVTTLRIPGAGVVAYLLLTSHVSLATFLYVLLLVTDFLDGQIARAFDQRTRLGTRLDPVADRLTVLLAASAAAATGGGMPRSVVGALIAVAVRDGLLLGMGFLTLLHRQDLPRTNFTGKLSSVAGMSGVLLTYLGLSGGWINRPGPAAAAAVILGAAAAFGFVSLLRYASAVRTMRPISDTVARGVHGDPYSHASVLECLDANPLGETLAAVYVELMRQNVNILDLRDPIQLVEEEIKRLEDALSRAEPSIFHDAQEEHVENLRMVLAQIVDMT